MPSLKPGNLVDRVAVISAMRRGLEQIGARPNARNADLTLIVPDTATRVLLLDFDSLPNKLSEALPLVRFRLKKLVPFDTDDAMISFQTMSSSRSVVRVIAVAMPRDVLAEYESVAREAGFEPGAVLPSTLAALAATSEGEGASLVVNAHPTGVTTAIVRAGIVLLHRTVELTEQPTPLPAQFPAALFESGPSLAEASSLLQHDQGGPFGEAPVRAADTEFGRDAYADRVATEVAVEGEDSITGLPLPSAFGQDGSSERRRAPLRGMAPGTLQASGEPAPASHSPYAAPNLQEELAAEGHHALSFSSGVADRPASREAQSGTERRSYAVTEAPEPRVHLLAPDLQAEEIAKAVSVAVAFFEDTLGAAPEILLSAGSMGAERLERTLREQGVAQGTDLHARELVEAAAFAPGAVTASVSRGALAGTVGALRS